MSERGTCLIGWLIICTLYFFAGPGFGWWLNRSAAHVCEASAPAPLVSFHQPSVEVIP